VFDAVHLLALLTTALTSKVLIVTHIIPSKTHCHSYNIRERLEAFDPRVQTHCKVECTLSNASVGYKVCSQGAKLG
jgi:hypothetical protein